MYLNDASNRFTFVVVVADVRRGCSHLQGQAIGPLERVAVPDQEGPWLSLFQSCDRYRPSITTLGILGTQHT